MKKYIFLSFFSLLLSLTAYGAFVYWQTQEISDPNQCFITSMYHISLCPSNPNYVNFKQVPQHFFQALILSEDASFYSHNGFDWFEIKESLRRNILEWRFARGGSTLTQQLAKNLYLTKEKSLDRKFKEFFIAKQIEKKLNKKQILEKYINVVEFGPNIFGLSKASQYYFNKSPGALNTLESIYLVSLLPSPERLSTSFKDKKLSKENLRRMDVILSRLYRYKRISDESYVYCQMLLESEPWPFDLYTDESFEINNMSLEEELKEELDSYEPDSSLEEPTDETNSEEIIESQAPETTEENPENISEEINDESDTP